MSNQPKPKLSPEFSVLFCTITKGIKHLQVEQRLQLETHLRQILLAIEQASV